jgi:hypothetical protein
MVDDVVELIIVGTMLFLTIAELLSNMVNMVFTSTYFLASISDPKCNGNTIAKKIESFGYSCVVV